MPNGKAMISAEEIRQDLPTKKSSQLKVMNFEIG